MAAAAILVAACGGEGQAGSATAHSDATTTSASSSAPPVTVDSYVAQARAICAAGEQKVYDEVNNVLHGVLAPSQLPSDSFVLFYRHTHTIGLDVIAKLRNLPVPPGTEARRDADLAVMGSAVNFTSAAGRAASRSDKAAYVRIVSGKTPDRPANGLLPAECQYLSLGPGAGR